MSTAGLWTLILTDAIKPPVVCHKTKCQNLLTGFGYDPARRGAYFGQYNMLRVEQLPPHVKGRYIRLLRLWRSPHRQLPRSLYESCLYIAGKNNLLTPHILRNIIRERNVVIHRAMKRLLVAYKEAYQHEWCRGSPWAMNRPPSNFTHFQSYIHRWEYLSRKKCPLDRLRDEMSYYTIEHLFQPHHDEPAYRDHELDVEYYLDVHQCGYIRCTCDPTTAEITGRGYSSGQIERLVKLHQKVTDEKERVKILSPEKKQILKTRKELKKQIPKSIERAQRQERRVKK